MDPRQTGAISITESGSTARINIATIVNIIKAL